MSAVQVAVQSFLALPSLDAFTALQDCMHATGVQAQAQDADRRAGFEILAASPGASTKGIPPAEPTIADNKLLRTSSYTYAKAEKSSQKLCSEEGAKPFSTAI